MKRLVTCFLVSMVAVSSIVLSSHKTSASDTVSITIVGKKLKYNPDEIRVKKGETIEVTMKNEGFVSHSFDIPELDIRTHSVQPDSFVQTTFTADYPAGKYEFICDVSEHKLAGMKGTLIVEENN